MPAMLPITQRRVSLMTVVVALALTMLAGCCRIDQDPRYNQFAPHNGRRPLLKQADLLLHAVHQTLDNCDRRLDNILY